MSASFPFGFEGEMWDLIAIIPFYLPVILKCNKHGCTVISVILEDQIYFLGHGTILRFCLKS